MTEWEEQLKNTLQTYKDNITVPEDLEAKLRASLPARRPRKLHQALRLVAAVAGILLLLNVIYFSPVLANQVQRILGYEQVMNKTLANLNENGQGQPLSLSYTDPQTGVGISLDGVIIDNTQLILFYTLKGTAKYPAQNLDVGILTPLRYKELGLWDRTLLPHSGHGQYDEQANEIKWQMAFDSPSTWTKTLYFTFRLEFQSKELTWQQAQQQTLTIKLDHTKAIASTIKQTLDIPFQVGDAKFIIRDLEAAPTQTVVHFTGQDAGGLDKAMGRPDLLAPDNIQLLVNGMALAPFGGGKGGHNGQWQYTLNTDAIQTKVEKLQLKISQITTVDNSQISIPLVAGRQIATDSNGEQSVPIDIKSITQNGNNLEVALHLTDEPLAGVTEATLTGSQGTVKMTDTRVENTNKVIPQDANLTGTARIEYDQVLIFPDTVLNGSTTLNITKAKMVHHPDRIIDIPVQ